MDCMIVSQLDNSKSERISYLWNLKLIDSLECY